MTPPISPHRPRRHPLGATTLAIALLATACASTTTAASEPVETPTAPPASTRPPGDDAVVVERLDEADPSELLVPVDQDWSTDEPWFATGFLDFLTEWDEPDDHTAGFSMYVAAWPLQATYPGPGYQTGLPSTWLVPTGLEDIPGDNYSTIEGGLGWWNDTRFATETPKFIMGGVSRDFFEWANGPGAGAGYAPVDHRDWDEPQGKYGVAQLSPYVLWAPDGLNLEVGTNGELFGYGYHPLPIVGAQADTAGSDVSTGDRSWTLFLSTENFQGPVSFFIPNFFSKPTLDDPELEGAFFDANDMDPGRFAAMETQVIPAAHGIDADGGSWARVTRIQFPANDGDASIILNQIARYAPDALWQPTTSWFSDGTEAPATIDDAHTRFSRFEAAEASDTSTWTILYEGIDENEEYPIEWERLAEIDASDPLTFRYRWNMDLVQRDGDSFVLPEYFRLVDTEDGPAWRPVRARDVPEETGLQAHEFPELGTRNDSEPYVTPTDADSVWVSPGPASETFQVDLGDGSTLTYAWYRFVDQPAIQHWGFSDAELEQMQTRVEAIHEQWTPDHPYLAPPSAGELARLDPGILVDPPAGLEVGYVPIVLRQELTR